MRKKYETDLTDEQWDVIAPLFVNTRKRKWDKLHSFYRRARLNGLWDKILEHLVKVTRQKAGLSEEPTQADDIGCLLAVAIHKVNLHDTKIGYWVTGLAAFAYPTLEKICGDGGYRRTFVYEAYKYFGLQVEISKKLKPHVWQVLPKRWIVERTFFLASRIVKSSAT